MIKIERPSIKEQVLKLLRGEIIRGDIKPGEQIIESELARNLGISRGPVHEAVTILENDGFVQREESGSIYVAKLTKSDVFEIYSMRSVIEGLAARLAVVKFTADDIKYFDQCLANIAELKNNTDGVTAVPNTMEIHRFLMEKADHKRVYELWKNINLQLKMLASVVMFYDRVEDTLIKHTKLVESLKTMDPDRAERAIREHIMDAWKIADKYMQEETEQIQSVL
ncbi:MAG: GntR family transcriptional regulator [Peptococcaceae bacterium]